MDIEAIIFDLDGTLIDSVPAVTTALNLTLNEEGLGPLAVSQVKSMVGLGARVMFDMAIEASAGSIPEEEIEGFTERYLAHYMDLPIDQSCVYPGVIEVLAELQATGVLFGICTNKPRVTTDRVIEGLGWKNFFKAIVGPTDVARRKPHADHVLQTVNVIGANVDRTIYVGDSDVDAEAAHNADLPLILVSYGYSQIPVNELDAAAVIDTFADLPTALGNLAGDKKKH